MRWSRCNIPKGLHFGYYVKKIVFSFFCSWAHLERHIYFSPVILTSKGILISTKKKNVLNLDLKNFQVSILIFDSPFNFRNIFIEKLSKNFAIYLNVLHTLQIIKCNNINFQDDKVLWKMLNGNLFYSIVLYDKLKY